MEPAVTTANAPIDVGALPGNTPDPSAGLQTVATTAPSAAAEARPIGRGVTAAASTAMTGAPGASPFTCSDSIDQIIGALVLAQLAFETIVKNKEADVQSKREGARSFKYRYADLGEVLSVVRPALAEHGIALMQFPFTREKSVVIVTILGHVSGQWMRNDLSLPAQVTSLDPQDIGKVITYGRRYAGLSILGVAPEDDPDGAIATPAKNGNGHSARPVPMPERASTAPTTRSTSAPSASLPPSPPNGGASGLLLRLARVEKHERGGKSPWWEALLVGPQGGTPLKVITFSTTIGANLEQWHKSGRLIQECITKPRADRNDRTVVWNDIVEIVAAPDNGGGQ